MQAPRIVGLAAVVLFGFGAGGAGGEPRPGPWELNQVADFVLRLKPGEILLGASPDARKLALSDADGKLRVLDVTAASANNAADGETLAGLAAAPVRARWAGNGILWVGDHAGNLTAWDLASHSQRLAIPAHQGPILDLAFAPDGKIVATAGFDKSVKLWDTTSGNLVRVCDGHAASVRAVAFSPAGALLASAGGDRSVFLWDLAGGDAPRPRTRPRVLEGHSGTIRALLFAPDGSWLASAGEDKRVILWDPQSGAEQRRLAHEDMVASLALFRRGEMLATGSWDGVISLWDPRSGNKRYATDPWAGGVLLLWEAPNGEVLASHAGRDVSLWQPQLERQTNSFVLEGTTDAVKWIFVGVQAKPEQEEVDSRRDPIRAPRPSERIWTIDEAGMVRIWDERGGTVGQFRAHKGSVATAALSPDSKVLATAGRDRALALWDAQSGTMLGRHGDHAGLIHALSFSPDGKYLVSAGDDRRVVVRRAEDGQPEGPGIELPAPVAALDFEPDSQTLLAALRVPDPGRILRLDLARRAAVGPEISLPRPVSGLACAGSGILVLDDSGSLLVIEPDVASGPRSLTRPNQVKTLALSADRTRFVTGHSGGIVRLWDVKDWRPLREMVGVSGSIGSVSVGPRPHTRPRSRGLVAAAPRGGFGYAWASDQAGSRKGLTGHDGPVTGVALTPDGTRILSCARDGSIRVWDAAKHSVLGSLDFETDHFLAAAAGGHTGVVAAGDGSILVLDLLAVKALGRLAGHADEVKCVSMAADGKTAVSGGRDGTIRLWNLESMDQLRTFEETGDHEPVTAVVLSADGRRVLAAGGTGGRQFLKKRNEGVLRIWDTATGEVTARLVGPAALCAALSPDGRLALVGGKDGSLTHFDASTGDKVRSWKGHGGLVTACSLSADGRLALSGGFDKTVRLWDLATGTAIDHDGGMAGAVLAAALAPGGEWAVSGGTDSLVTIWSLKQEPKE